MGARTPGMQYRPEYHYQHKLENVPIKQLDHRKLTFKQLIYGMTCVAHYVLSTGGNVDSYLQHMEFVSRHSSDNSFLDCSYSEYDKCVIDNFLKSPLGGFNVADSTAIGYAFHPGKLNQDYVEKLNNPGKQKRRFGKRMAAKGEIPDGYPEGNCFHWNYRNCTNTSCQRKHVCRICEGHHKAVGCPREKK